MLLIVRILSYFLTREIQMCRDYYEILGGYYLIYLFWSQPHSYSWETFQNLMCWCWQIFRRYPCRLLYHSDHFFHFSLKELVDIFNVITTFKNNNVKPWCVCTRWITKTIVGSIYIWKWLIRLQIEKRYFIIFLFFSWIGGLNHVLNLVLLSLIQLKTISLVRYYLQFV